MAVIKESPDSLGRTSTMSPTATGLVVLMPLILKLPLIRHGSSLPVGVFTMYELPVFLITVPVMRSKIRGRFKNRF